MESYPLPSHYASADDPTIKERDWVYQQWDLVRYKAKTGPALLVFDEIQKIPGWSKAVKSLWDSDTMEGSQLQVLPLVSSSLLIRSGLTESLTGVSNRLPRHTGRSLKCGKLLAGIWTHLYLTRMEGTRSDLLLDTEAIDAEFHSVADAEILGWVETESDSGGCAGGNDIARKKGHEPAEVAD